MHFTQALTLSRKHLQPFELMPVILPVGKRRQQTRRNPDLRTAVAECEFTVFNTFKPDDDPLPLAATLFKPCRNTLAVQNQSPVAVVQYSVSGIGIREDLKPTLDPEHRGNPADHSFLRMLRHAIQTPVSACN